MITINPKILENNGKKEYAIIPYREYLKVKEELEDYESLKLLRRAKSKEEKSETISLQEAKKLFGV